MKITKSFSWPYNELPEEKKGYLEEVIEAPLGAYARRQDEVSQLTDEQRQLSLGE